MNYKRNIRIALDHAIKTHPAVTIIGARGVGKTSLVADIAAQKNYAYCNLEEIQHAVAAHTDPANFIAQLPKPVVIDALHRVPTVVSAINADIVKNKVSGRYICVSSSDPVHDHRLKMLNQSTHILKMHPLSQGELAHKTERFIDAVFNMPNLITDDLHVPPFDKAQFLHGGFAQTLAMSSADKDRWFNRYVLNLVHHDVALQMQVEDHLLFVRLLRVLAQHVGQPLNAALISRQTGIPITTLSRYMAVLRSAQILVEQGAWDGNGLIKKAIKAPQAYMHDIGLASWLLDSELHAHADYQERFLKHAVYNELQKQMAWNDTPVELLHMRTMNGCDVDMILQRADGKAVGIWVKNGAYITAKDTKGLLHCKDRLGDRWHRGIVLHTGNEIMPLGNKLWMMPISALWGYA